jgi:hypothetical protein
MPPAYLEGQHAMTKQFTSLREKIAHEKAERALRYEQFQALFAIAQAKGIQAGNDAIPTPMIVMDSMGTPIERVDSGACGFAWVNVRPGNSSFAKWLVANKLARRSYYGGVEIWISAHGQSWERKCANAGAMAQVFRNAGFNASAGSRLD